jgi:branched-chain amino acid transport system ATP-binding protein
MRPPTTQPLLRLDAVSKSFGGIRALSGVSCDIAPGKIVGVIGPNGAGKTTLFNVITGAYRADGGAVEFDREPITAWPPYRIARAGIARTFQNIRLFAGMSVWEHLLVAQPHREEAFRRLLPTRWTDPAARERAEQVLAFALTASPKVLLLDEPVAGMNHEEAAYVKAQLLRLRADGLTVLLIEHDMNFVMNLCDYLYVMDFGALIAQGTPAEVRNNPAVLDAYLGTEA